MIKSGALKAIPDLAQTPTFEAHTAFLTNEQLECLSRCAKGISLRFEAADMVDALVAGGYAAVGVARVVTMTDKGHRYLQMHPADARLQYRQARHEAALAQSWSTSRATVPPPRPLEAERPELARRHE